MQHPHLCSPWLFFQFSTRALELNQISYLQDHKNQTIFCLSNYFPKIFPQNISKAAFLPVTSHFMLPTFHSCTHDLTSDCYQTWVCHTIRSRIAHMHSLPYWLKIKYKKKERRKQNPNSLPHWGSYSVNKSLELSIHLESEYVCCRQGSDRREFPLRFQ